MKVVIDRVLHSTPLITLMILPAVVTDRNIADRTEFYMNSAQSSPTVTACPMRK